MSDWSGPVKYSNYSRVMQYPAKFLGGSKISWTATGLSSPEARKDSRVHTELIFCVCVYVYWWIYVGCVKSSVASYLLKFISYFPLNLYKHFEVVFQSSVGVFFVGLVFFFIVENGLPQVLSIKRYISVAEWNTIEASNIIKMYIGGKVCFVVVCTK